MPYIAPHKTAIMLPFDWIAAFSLCVFSVGGFGAFNPPGKVFSLSLFPPSGVYSFSRQKHQAVWKQAGAAAWCQEVFSPHCLWVLPALHQRSIVQSCNASGVSRARGLDCKSPCVAGMALSTPVGSFFSTTEWQNKWHDKDRAVMLMGITMMTELQWPPGSSRVCTVL